MFISISASICYQVTKLKAIILKAVGHLRSCLKGKHLFFLMGSPDSNMNSEFQKKLVSNVLAEWNLRCFQSFVWHVGVDDWVNETETPIKASGNNTAKSLCPALKNQFENTRISLNTLYFYFFHSDFQLMVNSFNSFRSIQKSMSENEAFGQQLLKSSTVYLLISENQLLIKNLIYFTSVGANAKERRKQN